MPHPPISTIEPDLRTSEAETLLRQNLRRREDPFVLAELAALLQATARIDEAEAAYRRALELNPSLIELRYNLANLLLGCGKSEEAQVQYRFVLRAKPDYVDAWINMGSAFRTGKQLTEAEICYRRALELNPRHPDAFNNLGVVLRHAGKYEDALDCYKQAAAIRPEFPAVHNNLAMALFDLGRFNEALASCRRALEIDPTCAEAHHNLSRVLMEYGRHDDAMASCMAAISLDPEEAGPHITRAFLLLLDGNFSAGLPEYEYRWKAANAPPSPGFPQALWLGDADIAGKTILLYAEQGFGDVLHSLRYTGPVAARGATVFVLVPPQLKTLAAGCAGVTRTFVFGDRLPPFDYQCPMMSLPLACGCELSNISTIVPYLKASEEKMVRWRDRLGTPRNMRVGLTWAGGLRENDISAKAVDRRRSMHFDRFLPLLDLPGIDFFSLQVDKRTGTQTNGNPRITDFTDLLHDFEDSAALISNLDLVICVDTSVAHLTGALGKPVWMLNRFDTCWRWMKNRSDSPWYPSMRIFRQPALGDWDRVIADVRQALTEATDAIARH